MSKFKTSVRRIETTVSVDGLFNKEREFIEYFNKPGIFYEIGNPLMSQVGLDINLVDKLLKENGIKEWYIEKPNCIHTKTSYFKMVSEKYSNEFNEVNIQIEKLTKRRDNLYKILGKRNPKFTEQAQHYGISE